MLGSGVHLNSMGEMIPVITKFRGQCGVLALEQPFRLSPGMSAWIRLARSASAMSGPTAINSRAVFAAATAAVGFFAFDTQKSRSRESLVSTTGVKVGK